MTTPEDTQDLGLAEIAPVDDVPDDVFERMVAVAVDPSTPPVDDDLLPDDSPPASDDGEVDLGDLDDDADDPEDAGNDADVAPTDHGHGDDPDPLDDPVVDPAVDPVSYTDPFADEPGEDPAGYTGHDTADVHDDPQPFHDDPGV